MGINALQPDLNQSSGMSKLDRIRQQIPNHLLQTLVVPKNNSFTGSQGDFEFNPFGISGRAYALGGCLNNGFKLTPIEIKPQLAGNDPRNLQEIVDQLIL